MMTDKKKKENPKINLVFVGMVSLKGNTRGSLFYEVTDEQIEEGRLPKDIPERVYSGKIGSRAGRPGSVWEVETDPNDPTTIFTNSLSFVCRWPDKEKVTRWQMENDAWETIQRVARTEKEEKNKNLVAEQLEPLRTAYRSLKGGRPAKAAFLAHVIAYIQG